MSIAPNLSSTASSISTVVVRFPPKPTIHIAFDQSYQHPIDKITMQTFGTAVIDHILHHIVHKVLVAYGFEKPFDCKTMPSHILSWQQSVLRSSLLHSAAPSGSWCGGQRQLSAANGSLVLGGCSGFNHHGVVLGCTLQDSVGGDLVIQNHGAPACRFPLRADNGAEINLASLLQNFK